jgi:ABC-type dipeptide/oligopeptide/nickel transport system permease component
MQGFSKNKSYLTSTTVVAFNALSDVAYAFADPRIRIE